MARTTSGPAESICSLSGMPERSSKAPDDARHIMGTLRFGTDPSKSVCDRGGRFHDIANLHAADGALFPTSSGFNPILIISAVGAWVGASMIDAERPASSLPVGIGTSGTMEPT